MTAAMGSGGGGGGGRPEPWTPAETAALIDEYEQRWLASRHGQLRAHQWEEISAAIAARLGLPAAKTGTQCRHKMEKLRQRYRAEKSRPSVSQLNPSWPFFYRLDRLERSPSATDVKKSGNSMQPPVKRHKVSVPNDGHGFLFSNSNSFNFPQSTRSPRFFKKPSPTVSVSAIEYDQNDSEEVDDSDDDRGGDSYGEDGESGLDLAGVINGFAEKLLRMETRRMELMREMERERMKMEQRRTVMIVEASRQLAERISDAFADSNKE